MKYTLYVVENGASPRLQTLANKLQTQMAAAETDAEVVIKTVKSAGEAILLSPEERGLLLAEGAEGLAVSDELKKRAPGLKQLIISDDEIADLACREFLPELICLPQTVIEKLSALNDKTQFIAYGTTTTVELAHKLNSAILESGLTEKTLTQKHELTDKRLVAVMFQGKDKADAEQQAKTVLAYLQKNGLDKNTFVFIIGDRKPPKPTLPRQLPAIFSFVSKLKDGINRAVDENPFRDCVGVYNAIPQEKNASPLICKLLGTEGTLMISSEVDVDYKREIELAARCGTKVVTYQSGSEATDYSQTPAYCLNEGLITGIVDSLGKTQPWAQRLDALSMRITEKLALLWDNAPKAPKERPLQHSQRPIRGRKLKAEPRKQGWGEYLGSFITFRNGIALAGMILGALAYRRYSSASHGGSAPSTGADNAPPSITDAPAAVFFQPPSAPPSVNRCDFTPPDPHGLGLF